MVLLWPVCAQAESAAAVSDRPVANQLTEQGRVAFENCEYFAAAELLTRAAELDPAGRTYLYLARVHAAAGRLLLAAEDYRHALDAEAKSAACADSAAVTEEARHELSLLEARIPSLVITPGETEQRTPGLRIVLDGQPTSALGHSVRVDPGPHQIFASAEGGVQARLAFDIGEHDTKTIHLAWRTSGVRAAQGQTALNAGTSGARRTWSIVALGVGATGLGVGTVTGIAAISRYSAAEQNCPAGRCTQGAQYPDDGSAFRALRTISAAGYAVGVTGIGTWLGLLLTAPTENPEHPHVTAWTPVVGVGSAGARYAF